MGKSRNMTEQEAIQQLIIQRSFSNGNNAKVEAIDMAIKALEKQIAKQPRYKSEYGQHTVYCPNCNSQLFDVDWNRSTQEKYHRSLCICCGQRFTKPTKTLGYWD